MAVDMLGMFKKDGVWVAAESQAAVDTSDPFTIDFSAGKYFDLDSFDMGIKLNDKDSTNYDSDKKKKTDDDEDKKKSGSFSKWVQGIMPPNTSVSSFYPLEMEEVSFSRQIDSFSPLLFQMCFQTKSFDQVTFVKRKISGLGSNSSTGIGNIPFFRVDFKQVLVIGLTWEAEEMIKEKCKFVCRSVAVRYRPQLHPGTAGATIGGQELNLSGT